MVNSAEIAASKTKATKMLRTRFTEILENLDVEGLAEMSLRRMRSMQSPTLSEDEIAEIFRRSGYAIGFACVAESIMNVIAGYLSIHDTTHCDGAAEAARLIETAGETETREMLEDLLAQTGFLLMFLQQVSKLLGQEIQPADYPAPHILRHELN